MHAYRDAPAIILNRGRAVLFQRYMNLRAVTRKVFIYGIVYNLIYQMVKSFRRNTPYIHAGPFPDCLQSL